MCYIYCFLNHLHQPTLIHLKLACKTLKDILLAYNCVNSTKTYNKRNFIYATPMWSKSMMIGFHPKEAGAFPAIGCSYSLMAEHCFDTAIEQVQSLLGACIWYEI